MTHTDYIKLILNIKDNNVYFYDDFLKKWNVKLNATPKIIKVAFKQEKL